MRYRRVLLPVVLVLGLLTGCDAAGEQPTSPPDAKALVSQSAKSLAAIRSVKFNFSVNGTIPGFPVSAASGVAKRSGWAQGRIELLRGLEHTEYSFTTRDDGSVRLTAGDDERTRRAVPDGYAPAELLSEREGLGRLLLQATALKTETTETLHGTPTYRVTGTLAQDVLAEVVPGVWSDAIVKFWVNKKAPHTLQRVWIQLPPRQPNAGVVAIQLALSKHNAVSEPTTSTSDSAPSSGTSPTSPT